jgi:probable HAF family extracellular repeat protein
MQATQSRPAYAQNLLVIFMMRHSFITLVTVSFLAISISSAHAQSITNLGDLTGGTTSATGAHISADGTTVVGSSTSANGTEAFLWASGTGMVGIGDLPGSIFYSVATGVSDDGTAVAGTGSSTNGTEAFFWTSSGGMVALGDLAGGGFSSNATGISGDGTTVIGQGYSGSGFQAFRWTSGGGMVGLGDLAGGLFFSTATGVNYDGTIIVGSSYSSNGVEAFRWTSGTGMVGLGDLAGGTFASIANAISSDGTTIVGSGTSASGGEAFRWTQAGGMVGLGDLAGGTFSSSALGVNADGSVIVGYSADATGNTAFRWTQATGMQSLASILTAGGVDLTGWLLPTANNVDATGNLIVGNATVGGNSVAYLANLNTMAVTTPVDLETGLTSAIIPVQQSQSAMNTNLGQSLFAATQSVSILNARLDMTNPAAISPAAGGDESSRNWSGYVVGSFGAGQDNDFDNNELNGTMGLIVALNKDLAIGAGVIGSHSRADRIYGGQSTLTSKGGALVAAYKPESGLRIYSTAFVADLGIDSKRNYLNGAGTDTSYADIDGIGYGAALRTGYEFALTHDTNMMPYVEFQASRTKLDGYTETGGGFPASFGKTTSDQVTSYLGTQVSYDVTPTLTIGGRAAWAHRLKQSDDGLSASTTGFSGTLGGETGDRNWVDGALTLDWQVTDDTRLGTELSGRSGKTQDPAAMLTFGVKTTF